MLNFNFIKSTWCIRIKENLTKKIPMHTYAYTCTRRQQIRGDINRLKISFFWSSKVLDEPISSTLRRKQEDMAAKVIQKAFRKGRDTQEREKPATEASDSSPLVDALEWDGHVTSWEMVMVLLPVTRLQSDLQQILDVNNPMICWNPPFLLCSTSHVTGLTY